MCIEAKFQRAFVDAHLGFHRTTAYFSCCFMRYYVSFTFQRDSASSFIDEKDKDPKKGLYLFLK